MRVPIYQIDAFTSERFKGNPAAVMMLEHWPSDEQLTSIAAENNLAETAFILREGAEYQIRWFTPEVEIALCGHATLASAFVICELLEPGRTAITFSSKSGSLHVRKHGEHYTLNFPARVNEAIPCPAGLAEAIGIAPLEVFTSGPNYLALLPSADAVRALKPDFAAIARLDQSGLVVTAPGDKGFDCVSRFFAPAKGVPEDPVTGSAHCGLAPFWAARLDKQSIRAWQASPRGGEIQCKLIGDRVELSGTAVFYMQGVAEI
ncbi:PhzF family phenazine biosynthesis protein [Burkholderiaceae bacterium DAT-1]|nr:PhzF family phenazine biosynthesis protein [Burkholderiaceae bacterium DAT-1]